jgi:hypothetical protein
VTFQQLLRVIVNVRDFKLLCRFLRPLDVRITNGDEFNALRLPPALHVSAATMNAAADDGDGKFGHKRKEGERGGRKRKKGSNSIVLLPSSSFPFLPLFA